MEGTGAPDVRAIAMDLGVIDGRDMIAVPEPPGGSLDQPGQAGGDVVGVPGAVLGEGFQRLPVSGPFQGQDRLGDGVLLAVDGHGGALGTGRKQLPDFTLTGEQPDSSTWGETRRTQSSWSS